MQSYLLNEFNKTVTVSCVSSERIECGISHLFEAIKVEKREREKKVVFAYFCALFTFIHILYIRIHYCWVPVCAAKVFDKFYVSVFLLSAFSSFTYLCNFIYSHMVVSILLYFGWSRATPLARSRSRVFAAVVDIQHLISRRERWALAIRPNQKFTFEA